MKPNRHTSTTRAIALPATASLHPMVLWGLMLATLLLMSIPRLAGAQDLLANARTQYQAAAYDEALTTPTEESVRRAVAIQLIINRELGLNKIQNPWQGSFAIEALTDLVEEAVYKEFESLAERGGVLGAMESMYQRGKIQEESLHYETRKHDGSLPIVGVNTFLNEHGESEHAAAPLFRASEEEQNGQVAAVRDFQARHAQEAPRALQSLQAVAAAGGNVFAELLETVQTCSLGQITRALYEVGGQYRRHM